jgi:energy-coupling factor transporter transmembrane protein EcfT
MANKIPSFLLDKPASNAFVEGKGKIKMSFIEKGMNQFAGVIKSGYIQWDTVSMDGYFQRIDARIKILFLIFYVVIVSLKKEIIPEIYLGSFVFALVLLSRLNIFSFYKKVFLLGFFFGFLIAAPSALNLIVKGEVIFPVLHLSKDYNFWVYHIPAEIGITREGLNVVAMLTMRVVNSLTISFLVLYTTSFPDIIKALKVMKVPDSFLMIITLSYKYIFIFAKTVEDMYRAKKSKLVRQVDNRDARKWAAGRMGFIFNKTRLRCEEIFKAMLSRGFSEEVKLYESRKLDSHDIVTGGILLIIGVFFLWI